MTIALTISSLDTSSFEEQEVQEQSGRGQKSLHLDGGVVGESHYPVVSGTYDGGAVASSLLLDAGHDQTTDGGDVEQHGLAWLAWRLGAAHTLLAAFGLDLVLELVDAVVHFQVQVAVALARVDELAHVGTLAVLDVVDVDDWTSPAQEGAGAWSFELEERSVVGLFVVVSELDVEGEGTAATTEELTSAAVRLLTGSEELDTGLLATLVDVEDGVGVLTFAAGSDFGDVDLLLDEETFLVESFEASWDLASSSAWCLDKHHWGLSIDNLLGAWLSIDNLLSTWLSIHNLLGTWLGIDDLLLLRDHLCWKVLVTN